MRGHAQSSLSTRGSIMNRFTRFSSWAVLAGSLAVGATAASAQQELIEAAKNPGQWVMPGRTYDLQRHSPLKQITTANVKDLQVAWTFSTGVLRGHEGNPLVIGHVMYVHSAFPNKVFALDLSKQIGRASCRERVCGGGR